MQHVSYMQLHISKKHNSMKDPLSDRPPLSIQDTSSKDQQSLPFTPQKESVNCIRNVEGCLNSLEVYSEPEEALCPTCKLLISSLLEASPPPPNLCLCCQQSPCLPQSSFCTNCTGLLLVDNHVDSGWGVWRLDRYTQEIVCIDYGEADI